MKQWWRGLLLRERLLVIGAGVVLLLLAFHALLWTPWQEQGTILQEQIEQAEDDLAWMKQAVTRLPPSMPASAAPAAGPGNLVTRMNRLIGQVRLRERMKQMKPAGEHAVRLRFERVAFDRLLQLLKLARQQGLEVREMRLQGSDSPGRVNASMTLRERG